VFPENTCLGSLVLNTALVWILVTSTCDVIGFALTYVWLQRKSLKRKENFEISRCWGGKRLIIQFFSCVVVFDWVSGGSRAHLDINVDQLVKREREVRASILLIFGI
jgi:hypothetical protein